MVELSVQVMAVPVEARVSKFSTSGVPNAVMLPLLVSAEEGRNPWIPIPRQIAATTIIKAIDRKRIAEWSDIDIDEPPGCNYLRAWFYFVVE